MEQPVHTQSSLLEHLHIVFERLVLDHILRETEEQGQCHHEYGGHEPRHPQTQLCGETTAQIPYYIHLAIL